MDIPASYPFIFRRLSEADLGALVSFLGNLSFETRQRFAPHAFDREGLLQYYREHAGVFSIAGFSSQSGEMVCYAVIRRGYLEYEYTRFLGYGIIPCRDTDAMFAPVVADAVQGKGIGKQLFEASKNSAKAAGIKRLILWGGVQEHNEKAQVYYRKLGFEKIGFFLHNGINDEMILRL